MGEGMCDLCLKPQDVLVLHRRSNDDEMATPYQFCLNCYKIEGWDDKNPRRVSVIAVSQRAKELADRYRLVKILPEVQLPTSASADEPGRDVLDGGLADGDLMVEGIRLVRRGENQYEFRVAGVGGDPTATYYGTVDHEDDGWELTVYPGDGEVDDSTLPLGGAHFGTLREIVAAVKSGFF